MSFLFLVNLALDLAAILWMLALQVLQALAALLFEAAQMPAHRALRHPFLPPLLPCSWGCMLGSQMLGPLILEEDPTYSSLLSNVYCPHSRAPPFPAKTFEFASIPERLL